MTNKHLGSSFKSHLHELLQDNKLMFYYIKEAMEDPHYESEDYAHLLNAIRTVAIARAWENDHE